jgi:predicted transcriptional regulator
MPDPTPLSIRVTADVLARLDALAAAIARDPETAATISPTGEVSRSFVVRLALLEGIKALEKRFPPKPRRR